MLNLQVWLITSVISLWTLRDLLRVAVTVAGWEAYMDEESFPISFLGPV